MVVVVVVVGVGAATVVVEAPEVADRTVEAEADDGRKGLE